MISAPLISNSRRADQEDVVYEIHSPETESMTSRRKGHCFEDTSLIQRYVKLHTEEASSAGEISAKDNAHSTCHLPHQKLPHNNKYWIFLPQLSGCAYLISHDNYIRHTGYVLESADDASPSEYWLVREFFDLGRRAGYKVSMDWELKRREAKHWWRKEERGASGVKVGSFKLSHEERCTR